MMSKSEKAQEKRKSQVAPGELIADGYRAASDVTCDYCKGTKRKASKFCLQCWVNYCEEHLEDHNEVTPFKKHRLFDSSTNPQDMICSRHEEIRNIFCRTDRKCICSRCIDEHKGHDTVSTHTEMVNRQAEIREYEKDVKENIQDREKAINQLQQEVDQINSSAEEAIKASETMCNELVQLIKKKRSDVRNEIRNQQNKAVTQVKKVQNNLEKNLSQMKRMETQVEQLSDTKHDITFLQNSHLLPRLSMATVSAGFNNRPVQYFKDVQTAVPEAKKKIKQRIMKECKKISKKVTEVDVLLLQYPKTREDFSTYSFPLTLDPSTAHRQLLLSDGNTKVANVDHLSPPCSYNGEFRDKCQVLSKECLTGPCYWEVEWSGLAVSVAVSYKNISRSGDESCFGNNDVSWALECSSRNGYTFRHNSDKADVSGEWSYRIGVFLDPGAGTLVFYRDSDPMTRLLSDTMTRLLSDTMTPLHRVKATFTQPLYAGIGAQFKSVKAKLISLKNKLKEAKD